jgi:hypothetical protein
MLLPEIPWAGRCWALPFLTVLVSMAARIRQNRRAKIPHFTRSVSAISERQLDGSEINEVEIDDLLERLSGGAIAQAFGQGVGPGGVFGL